jgi:hypothetical protein
MTLFEKTTELQKLDFQRMRLIREINTCRPGQDYKQRKALETVNKRITGINRITPTI